MSLVAWWPLNGDLQDKVGGNDLVATNTSVNTLNNNGKIGKTYQSTSNSAGSMVSKNSFLLPSTQSMFCWIYMTSVYSEASLNAICGQHRYQKNSGMGITVKYNNSSSGYLSVNTGNGSSRTYNTYCGSTLLSTNTWYHVGFTYDGSTIRLYVNGVLDGTHSYSGQKLYSEPFGAYMWSFNSATVGDRTPYGGYCPQGRINDIRVYDHVLSAKEIKELSKALVVHYTFDSSSIGDGSGFGKSITSSNAAINTDTAIGVGSLKCSGNTSVISTVTGDITQGVTVSFWAKGSIPSDSRVIFADYNSKLAFGFYSNGQAIITCSGHSKKGLTSLSSVWTSGWNHVVLQRDASGEISCKINGTTPLRATSTNEWTHSSTDSLSIGCRYSGSWTSYFTGYISDFRVYHTLLSADDISDLYNTHWSVNRNGKVFTNTIEENSTSSKITSKGVQKINYVSEPIQLSDGSYWLQVSHHDNKSGTVLFASSDAFETKFVYKNSNCWSAFHLIKQHGLYNNKYEFMALEQLGTGSEHILRRWSQTVSPFTATYNDVKPGSSNVTHISNMPSMNGGMYKLNSNTYFCITNASNGNWYGAFGSWNKHGSGIPTFNNSSTAGTFDLYVRVSPAVAQKYREFKGGILMAQIDEI